MPAVANEEEEDGPEGTGHAPQHYYDQEPRELHIIQVPIPDTSLPPIGRPLQFQQEYPDREPPPREPRGRRPSVHDPYEFREDDRMQHRPARHTPSHHSQSHSHSHSNSHSPALSPRASHSLVMQREREPYSPAHRSPYQSPPMQTAIQQVPVPATFANLMNPYPPVNAINSSEPASPYENGTGRPRRGTGNGMDR